MLTRRCGIEAYRLTQKTTSLFKLLMSGVQALVLPLSARGTHHFTPHTCAPTHHFTPHTCTPTHHFTPHTCAPTHHSQLFPMCGLFMHLSPIPLPAEITSTRTHMCMYVYMFSVVPVVPITFSFVHSGHQHYVAVWGVPC